MKLCVSLRFFPWLTAVEGSAISTSPSNNSRLLQRLAFVPSLLRFLLPFILLWFFFPPPLSLSLPHSLVQKRKEKEKQISEKTFVCLTV